MSPDLNHHIRIATPQDVPHIINLKHMLAMDPDNHPESSRGGFVLGCSPEHYMLLTSLQQILVATSNDHAHILGFIVGLDDAILRQSEVWKKQENIEWVQDFNKDDILPHKIGYLDQLAVHPDAQRQYIGALLSTSMMHRFAASQHTYVMTTTLLEPITNTASIPLIKLAQGKTVGKIQEHYEGVGHVTSALHLIHMQRFQDNLQQILHEAPPEHQHVITQSHLIRDALYSS